MLKHTIIQILLSVMIFPIAFGVQSCDNSDEPNVPTLKEADRTILVYMVSNNNLGTDGADSRDIKEMIEGKASSGISNTRVLIFHKYRYTENGERKIAVQLNEITPFGIDTLRIYDNNEYAVSIKRMRDVIADVKTLAPAKSYGMVFWSHASGWLQDGIVEETTIPARSFGYDEYGNSEPKRMNITSLHEAIHDADLDFIYFDCCYMGSIETVYELRDCAPYIISSPCEIPGEGMPYNTVLPILSDTSLPLENMAVTAAQTTFTYYDKNFVRGDCPNTLSVVRTDALENLAAITRSIYEKAEKLYDSSCTYQRFTKSTPCYYFDFGQYVETICKEDADLAQWRDALAKAVVYAEASPWVWSTIKIEHYCGLSSYIPTSTTSQTTNKYNTLSWYADVASALFK